MAQRSAPPAPWRSIKSSCIFFYLFSFIYLSVCVCLPIYKSISQCIYLYLPHFISIHFNYLPYIYIYIPSIYLSISIYLSTYLSIYISIYKSIQSISVYVSIYLSIRLSMSFILFPISFNYSSYLSIYISMFICPPVYLSIHFFNYESRKQLTLWSDTSTCFKELSDKFHLFFIHPRT